MKFKLYFKDPVLIFGFTISWGTSIVFLITGQDNLLTFSIGVAGTVITLLMDILIEVKSHESKMVEALGFNNKLRQNSWLFESIRSIVDSCSIIEKNVTWDYFPSAMKDTLEKCNVTLQNLANGHLSLPANEDADIQLHLADSAKIIGKATSLVDATGWWRTPEGEKYLQANIRAISRGVKIIRVFIISKNQLESVRADLELQHKAGIEVHIAFDDEVTVNLLQDFMIWDDKVLLKAETTRSGIIRESTIAINERDVREAAQTFAKLLVQAKPFAETIKN